MRQIHRTLKLRPSEARSGRFSLSAPRSGGAVLIIVLTLLSTLVFLGFFYFAYTSQAENAARSYATAEDYKLDADEILDKTYEQILVGTRAGYPNSALYGNRHSIVSHIVGPVDLELRPTKDQPFSGAGIRMEVSDNGDGVLAAGEYLRFDFDGDGYPDATLDRTNDPSLAPLPLNFSKVARYDTQFYSGGTPDYSRGLHDSPQLSVDEKNVFANYQPHVGYTYPDINSLFLSYDSIVSGQRVSIPSYFRPQLELEYRSSGFDDYFTTEATSSRSLRPHSFHRLSNNTSRRFISASGGVQAESGDTRRIIMPFPFQTDLDGDGNFNAMGVLSRDGLYELDVDTDGDGIRDAIWMDLDLPLVTLPDGRQVVPLVAVKIVDADGLLNVNVIGNAAGVTRLNETPTATDSLGRPVSISKSNLGLSPAEVNPVWALVSDSDVSSPAPDIPSATSEAHLALSLVMGGATLPNAVAVANTELLFLLYGRMPLDGGSSLPGRYAGPATTEQLDSYVAADNSFIFTPFSGPRPGASNIDDDSDGPSGIRPGGGQDSRSEFMRKVANAAPQMQIPPAVHPLDFLGLGHLVNTGTARSYLSLGGEATPLSPSVDEGAQRRLTTPAALTAGGANPSTWPTYQGFWHANQDTLATTYGISGYHQAVGNQLQPNVTAFPSGDAITTDLTDEDNEVIANRWLYNVNDSLFLPSELAGLHLSNPDFALTGEYSRLRDLLPFAFRGAQNSSVTRRRFTTDSWDRLEFTRTIYNPFPDSFGPSSGNDEPMPRQWEFTVWTGYDAADVHFPPQFANSTVFSANDPFRSELRQLLQTTIRGAGSGTSLSNFDSMRARPQQRLNLNGLLVNFDSAGNPVYRPLTPHPNFADIAAASTPAQQTLPNMYHGQLNPATASAPNYEADPPAGAAPDDYPPYASVPSTSTGTEAQLRAQEWWARFDRQRMARDIYVLLWTLGGAQDLATGANAPYTQVRTYTDEQAREMAQFAVNVVDALDRDDVITRFEYVSDLTVAGWTNPDRVVYGVESQLLTLSEAMLINEPQQSGDLARTLHDDADSAHQFLYIELRNTSPFDVRLDDETWRIVRVTSDMPVGSSDANVEAAVKFKSDGTNSPTDSKIVGPGENFVIACHDGNVRTTGGQDLPADFYVDFEGGAEFEAVVPRATSTVTTVTPPLPALSDLDLNSTEPAHQQYHSITPLSVFEPTNGGTTLVGRDATSKTFDLVLQRRRNLLAKGHGEDLGAGTPTPVWVEVDRIKIEGTDVVDFSPGGDTQTVMQNFLTNGAGSDGIRSVERAQPFGHVRQERHGSSSPRNHTLVSRNETDRHGPNSNLAPLTQFTMFEPHFNRDFSSVMELLSIPIYGYQGTSSVDPDTLTPFSTNVGAIGGAVANLSTHGATNARMEGNAVAAVRFLNPHPALTAPYSTPLNGAPHYANRWYRLLEFLTVPDRSEEAIQPRLDDATLPQVRLQRRTPGKVNLNTIRDTTVLQGVVDDHDQLATVDSSTRLPSMDDRYQTTNRNWYDMLLRSRDGIDPTALNGGTTIAIPGSIASRPFRDLGFMEADRNTGSTMLRDNSIESTILRSLSAISSPPLDLSTVRSSSAQGIFDARTQADAAAGASTVDYHTRNRLLAKIHNRTTNRSHVFIVWTTVGFFEAHRLDTTNGAASGEVQIGAEATDIPRRRAFMACDMSQLEEAYEDPDPTDDLPGYYDFRKFIIYRKLVK
ncbi:hypothetical protein Pan44_36570 [Caulifigura coniformis]|uniref:Uncharacterized protein n=1 Tax=Caulifigura coniformis TaxID=2527983 RepID=A0A517SHL6_9PLAN|nr:hypothetical protein [Caulifigura coniformis]QDT55611.1 hypothetical protein Pan44_36570 [Caulifigura coniformis]